MNQSKEMIDDVCATLISALGIQPSSLELKRETRLFGNIPELDSMAVILLIVAIEERFGFTVEDDEVTAELFETVGSLTDYVERKSSEQSTN